MHLNRKGHCLAAALSLLFLAAASSARAHFLWAEIQPGNPPAFRLRFTEKAGEETLPDLLERIKPAKARTPDGKPLELKPADGALTTALPAGTRVVGVSQTWGVLDRTAQGRGVFLLQYYAKAAVDSAAASERANTHFEVLARKEGDDWVATVLHGRRPEVGAELHIVGPGHDEPRALKTDSKGEARFTLNGAGLCAIRASAVEEEAGEFEGKPYQMKRYYATLTYPVASTQAPASAGADSEAYAMLKEAHDRRETWDSAFPGFTARLRVEQDGKVGEGTVSVSASGDVEVQLEDPELKRLAERMLGMVVAHRRSGPVERRPSFAPSDRHPQGRAILLNDSSQSLYRLRDGQIMQVNRTMGDSRFTIDVLCNTLVEGGRYLPCAYTVTYRDAKTGVWQRVETFEERFQKVGGYYLPVERRVVTVRPEATSMTLLTLTDLRLAGQG